MADNPLNIPQDSHQQSGQITMAPKQMDADLVRHLIDTDPQRASFKFQFCGYIEETIEIDDKSPLGKPIKKLKTILKIGSICKICTHPNHQNGACPIKDTKDVLCSCQNYAPLRPSNEAGGEFLFAYVYGLVSPATATSRASAIEIYNDWHNTVCRELPWTLLKKILNEGNPFEMKIESIPEITAAIAKLYLQGKKTEDGWMYDLTSKQYQSQMIMHSGGIPVMQQPERKKILGIW